MSKCEGEAPLQRARSAWQSRDLVAAKQFIEEAFAAGPEGEELAHTRLTAGVVYREFGDTHLALEYLTTLIHEWHRYPGARKLLEGYALYNLALVHYQRRDYYNAIACNRWAAIEFQSENMHQHLRRALQNLAWSLCCLGNAEGAAAALEQAEDYLEDEEGHWQHRIGRVFVAFVEGGFRETIELARDIIRAEQAAPDVLCHALWLMGLAFVALGNHDEAVQIADKAIIYALQTHDTRCLSDAQSLKRTAYKAKQQPGA